MIGRPSVDAPPQAITARLFIVGASRSGTTLVQRILAAHPQIHSFPETSFFIRTDRGWGRLRVWLNLPTGQERAPFLRLLNRLNRPELADRPTALRTFSGAVNEFIGVLDQLTIEAGKSVWCEKSPKHVLHIPAITRYVSGARFIHVLRDGRDVVASIVQRARDFPQRPTSRAQLDYRYGVALWNAAIRTSARYFGHRGHHHLFYDDLLAVPERTARGLCAVAGVAFDPNMLTGKADTGVVGPDQPWMRRALEPPQATSSRFSALFDPQTQREIAAALNLDLYAELRTRVSRP